MQWSQRFKQRTLKSKVWAAACEANEVTRALPVLQSIRAMPIHSMRTYPHMKYVHSGCVGCHCIAAISQLNYMKMAW
jgi:hypothetical protein